LFREYGDGQVVLPGMEGKTIAVALAGLVLIVAAFLVASLLIGRGRGNAWYAFPVIWGLAGVVVAAAAATTFGRELAERIHANLGTMTFALFAVFLVLVGFFFSSALSWFNSQAIQE
jgi:hypothetical protein